MSDYRTENHPYMTYPLRHSLDRVCPSIPALPFHLPAWSLGRSDPMTAYASRR